MYFLPLILLITHNKDLINQKQEKVILPTLAPVDYKITKQTINITNKEKNDRIQTYNCKNVIPSDI